MSRLTWDEVKSRSLHQSGGLGLFCYDCYWFWLNFGLSCLKHATEDEKATRSADAHRHVLENGP